jgi:hypothetical protein
VSHNIGDAGALLGVVASAGAGQVTESLDLACYAGHSNCVVEDRGALSNAPLGGTDAGFQIAVLRGPCYLGLRTLAGASRKLDGLVLLAEPGRCLGRRDVEDVIGVPVVAEVAVTDRVARTIDAGILVTRFAQLREFLPLSRYVDRVDIPNTLAAASSAS